MLQFIQTPEGFFFVNLSLHLIKTICIFPHLTYWKQPQPLFIECRNVYFALLGIENTHFIKENMFNYLYGNKRFSHCDFYTRLCLVYQTL